MCGYPTIRFIRNLKSKLPLCQWDVVLMHKIEKFFVVCDCYKVKIKILEANRFPSIIYLVNNV